MCILYCVSKNDLYGYDVMKRMGAYFSDVDTSTFYSILRRLHKEKDLDCYFVESSEGPQRKYYTITEKGRETLLKLRQDWDAISDVVNQIFREE
ncbi:MAG: PadR family transcriptional regulator [Bacillota bacterium]|nr:PadR family transcriptional regulator [Bacillota bacterium]